MAEFSRLVITNKGQALLAKMMTGEGNVEFTKISTSDMEYTLEQLEALTEFSGVKQTLPVAKVTRTNGVAVTIEAIFNNLELTQGYHMRALGLYAIDPDDGEILYAVTAEMSGCCYMPAYNGITISGACIKLVTTVGNAENVSLEVDLGVYATVGEIKELRETVANTYLNKTGNSADNTVTFTQASDRTQIQSGEKHETLFGKVKKWFADLKAVAFSGSYNDLSDKPDAQSVGALPDTGGVIANDSDRSITIQPTYIQGDGTQRLTDFYKISADSVEGNCLYYGNDDTDERYVKRENVLKTMEEVDSDTSEENIAGAAAVRKLKSDLENNINQINSNLSDRFKYGQVTEQGTSDLFAAPWQGTALLIGWVVSATSAGAPTVCIVVSGSGLAAAITEINAGVSVSFQLAENGRTIQFINPYGNVCFWSAWIL